MWWKSDDGDVDVVRGDGKKKRKVVRGCVRGANGCREGSARCLPNVRACGQISK